MQLTSKLISAIRSLGFHYNNDNLEQAYSDHYGYLIF